MAGSYFSNDTIVAVATSLAGDGGVGVIRLSGPGALKTAQRVTSGFDDPAPRFLHRIEVRKLGTDGSFEILDDGLAVYFPKGQSFTGEEVVELQLHGGRFLLQSILRHLIEVGGCRMALPGEFSFRAVRNGKQTLSGAAGVGQLIRAKSMFEVQAARKSIGTARRKEFDDLVSGIRDLLAQSELSIDFLDQDVEVISIPDLEAKVNDLVEKADRLISQMKASQRIARGLLVTLTGAPNAGKSTLFNALLAEDRAIVSPEAGTTRDVITEEVAIGPYFVRIADTAGIRATRGQIEREGIERAQALLNESDAAVLVIDATQSADVILAQASALVGVGEKPIVVLNKWDRLSEEMEADLRQAYSVLKDVEILPMSALRSDQVGLLIERIQAKLDKKYGVGRDAFLPTEFQLQMLMECRAFLGQTDALVQSGGLGQPELVSATLLSAAKALSDLVGETTPDTILTKIFSEFCIGK